VRKSLEPKKMKREIFFPQNRVGQPVSREFKMQCP